MAHTRVLHVQRGFRMSKVYAEQVMRDHCTITWLNRDELTVRDTTDEERIALRAEQEQRTRLLEPLAFAEIHGIKFEPPASGLAASKRSGKLLWAAHEFVMSSVAA
ncbi:hypothetical protein P8936_16425 [Edaphobacter paludis]|uniref:Uncharacterized protein n=1 Tax=Edaphobacter paludis TaxID=3035702 RepID=A0AAU7D5D4_9BACT